MPREFYKDNREFIMALEANNDLLTIQQKVKLFAHDVHGVLTQSTFICDIERRRKYGFWHMMGLATSLLRRMESRLLFSIRPPSMRKGSFAPVS